MGPDDGLLPWQVKSKSETNHRVRGNWLQLIHGQLIAQAECGYFNNWQILPPRLTWKVFRQQTDPLRHGHGLCTLLQSKLARFAFQALVEQEIGLLLLCYWKMCNASL